MSLSSMFPESTSGCSALSCSCTVPRAEPEAGDKLCAEGDPEKDQSSATPDRAQGYPAAQPAKRPAALPHRRRGKIVEGFGKLAPALRQKNSRSIQLIRGLQPCDHYLLQLALLDDLCGARGAVREVRFNLFAFLVAYFLADVEDQQRCNVLAAQMVFKDAHRSPPNWLRSLRVARNREFFTVSSVVPSASPMARSFRP